MIAGNYHMVFMNLDASIISNIKSKYYNSNITSFQMFDPANNRNKLFMMTLNAERKANKKIVISYRPVKSLIIFIE